MTLYTGLGLFLLAAVGVGLLVSSVVATMQQAMLYSFMLVMPFTLLSGLTTPISSMPRSLQAATLINPLRYAIEIAHRVNDMIQSARHRAGRRGGLTARSRTRSAAAWRS